MVQGKKPSTYRRILTGNANGRLPRGNGRDLFLMCRRCARLRRKLYAWEARGPYASSARTTDWQCRTCAGLRYASEGGALVLRSSGSWFSKLFVGELRQALEGKTDRLGKTHRQPIAVRRRPNYCSCSYNTDETFLNPIYFRLRWPKTPGARAYFGTVFVAQVVCD